MLSTLMKAKSIFLNEKKYQSEQSQLLQELYSRLDKCNFKWMISKLDEHRIGQIKRSFQAFNKDPPPELFMKVILGTFNQTDDEFENLCLGLGALSLYNSIRGPERVEITYKSFIDFIYTVISYL